MISRLLSGLMLTCLGLSAADAAGGGLPSYQPAQPVVGLIRTWGSPHLGGLLRRWEAGFRRHHPDAVFSDSLHSTAAATYGLAENIAELALMGRRIYTFEYYGIYRRSLLLPVEIEVATGSLDVPHKSFALAIMVHRDNPLARLTLAQLDGVFGAERTGGWQGMDWVTAVARDQSGNIRTWGQLGLTGEWADRPIHPYGPPGVHPGGVSFFQSRVLGGSDRWAEGLREFADRAAMVAALGQDRYGIAFTGLCHATPEVKVLAVAEQESGPFVLPTRETVASRTYPLSRPVYFYFAPDTAGGERADPPVDPKVREFLRYVLSREGQAEVQAEGDYFPLTPAGAARQRDTLEHPPVVRIDRKDMR